MQQGNLAPMLQDKKAVIFDLDGTIVDSLRIWSRVDVLLAQALGCPDPDPALLHRLREEALERFRDAPQPYTAFCGILGEYFKSPLSAAEVHALRYKISREVLKKDVELRPGVERVITRLSQLGMRLAIVTTTKRANVDIYFDVNERIRSRIHLRDYFETVVTVEDVARIKPDPEGYCVALGRLGIAPSEALVVEDSRVGVTAARAAGIEPLVVREPFSEHDRPWLKAQARDYFEDFAALERALAPA